MINKGLVVKINDMYTVVLTEENEYIRVVNKSNTYLGQKIIYTSEDVVRDHVNVKGMNYMGKKNMIAAVLVVALAIGGFIGLNGMFDNTVDATIVSIVTVDINPSVKISINKYNQVVSIKAMNEEAEFLELEQFVGTNIEDAVEGVVILATDAGYIDEEDFDEDYVLITTIKIDEDEDNEDKDNEDRLKIRIEEKILESDELQNLNVAIIKATSVEMREAEDKKVPIGLYVVKGEIEIEGEKMSVSEYFSNKDHLKEFKNKGVVFEKKLEKKIEKVERFLDKLEDKGVDVTKLREALKTSDVDDILADLKLLWREFDEEEEDEVGTNKNKGNNKYKDKNEDEEDDDEDEEDEEDDDEDE